MYTPLNPSFTIQKWGLRGSKLYRHVFVMLCPGSVLSSNLMVWYILFCFTMLFRKSHLKPDVWFRIISRELHLNVSASKYGALGESQLITWVASEQSWIISFFRNLRSMSLVLPILCTTWELYCIANLKTVCRLCTYKCLNRFSQFVCIHYDLHFPKDPKPPERQRWTKM